MRHTDPDLESGTKLATPACVASYEIWPHRSLDRRGMAILLAVVAAAGTIVFLRGPATAVLPLAIGPFLAVGALAWALRCNNRAARKGEKIDVGPDVVTVTRWGAKGPTGTVQFKTGWVRLALRHDRDVFNRLVLTESGRTCSIGDYLSPDERKALAAALSVTIAEARGATVAP
jgi:uncharacterized membrane protein